MLTVQQLAARMNREAVEGLERNAQAVPEDKLTWKPLESGRSVLSQIAECAVITHFAAGILTARAVSPMDTETFGHATAELDTLEKALTALKSATDTLAAAIEAFPDEQLEATIQLPWDPEPQPFAQIMFIPYWNNVYHYGQVSYIQTLYGDMQMH